MSKIPNLTSIVWSQRYATTNVLGILKTDKPRNGVMHIVSADGGEHFIQRQCSIRLISNSTWLDAPQRGHSTGFIQIDVGLIPKDYFISSLTVNQQSEQIPHRA